LVKFGDQSLGSVWRWISLEWEVKDADKILSQLRVDAQQGFSIPDYPMTIQRTHARIFLA